MGLLQEGKWVDQWYDTKSSGGRFVAKHRNFAIGLHLMVQPDQVATAALRHSQTATTCMYHSPAHGLIAH